MHKPKISVIVPIYNVEKYLDKCLCSILQQSLTDIEVICIDDCSPDNSSMIVKKYMQNDKRIKLIKHSENLGLGGARNTGIKAAAGMYIAAIDSDDYIHPNMMEIMWNATENGVFDVVNCALNRVDEKEKIISHQKVAPNILNNSENNIDIFYTVNPGVCNKLFKTKLFIENNIFFPEYIHYEDLATTPRLICKSKKIKLISDCLYFYVIRENSITNSYGSKQLIDYFKVFEILRNFLIEENLYGHYKTEFLNIIDIGVRHHANTVASAGLEPAELQQYLRHFLMLKTGFNDIFDHISSMNEKELLNKLATARSRADLIESSPKTTKPISLIVKTFLRPQILERFLISIGNYQEKNNFRFAEILVGDDSPKATIDTNALTISKTISDYPHLDITHLVFEENIGASEGRNRLVQAANSPYVLLCDDDFILDEEADVTEALRLLESKQFDMIGGWLKNKYNFDTDSYEYWGSHGRIIESADEVIIELDERPINKGELFKTEYLLQFYLTRKQVLIDCPWDDDLKTEEHPDYFYRFKNSGYSAVLFGDLFVKHTGDRSENPPEYNEYRFHAKNWVKYLYKSLEKWGKSKRTMHRIRANKFVTWSVDANTNKSLEREVFLKEPIIGQRVPVRPVSKTGKNYFFGYYDVQSASEDGRYIVCQSAPVVDRLPNKDDIVDIVLIDTQNNKESRVIGRTSAWCHQQGAHLQFLPNKTSNVIFNVFNEHEKVFQSQEVDFATGSTKTHELPVAAISPLGDKAASVNFSRLFDYRPGYGYCHVPDPNSNIPAPKDDGLTVFDLESRESNLVLSYSKIKEVLAVGEFSDFRDKKWIINHVAFSPNGKKIMMLIRTFSDDAPFPTFTVVCNSDGTNLRQVFGFASHYHWMDDTILVASGSPGFTRKEIGKIKVYEIDTDSLEYNIIGEDVLIDDGHCSYSPDRSMLLYDCYPTSSFPYQSLKVYDLKARQAVSLGHFFSDPKIYNEVSDLRCDLHPRWSRNGKTITFDSMHNGFRGIYSIDVKDVKNALKQQVPDFSVSELKTWYSAKYDAQNTKELSSVGKHEKALNQEIEALKKKLNEVTELTKNKWNIRDHIWYFILLPFVKKLASKNDLELFKKRPYSLFHKLKDTKYSWVGKLFFNIK